MKYRALFSINALVILWIVGFAIVLARVWFNSGKTTPAVIQTDVYRNSFRKHESLKSNTVYSLESGNASSTMYMLSSISEYQTLRSLQAHAYLFNSSLSLLHYMQLIALQKKCSSKPLFVSMARVQSDLYWQLIKNFFSSMVHFGHIDCVVMVCISDEECVKRCKESHYPCYNYVHPNATTAHIMEQVATVKLYEVSLALESGIHVLLLDLDVGFLRDPLLLFDHFLDNPYEQVRSQMDLGTSWNKSGPYHFEYTWPSPNFGCFLIKSHPHSVKLMQRAWREYQKATPTNKKRVATDQNAMIGAIKWARWRWDYNFSYFSVGYYLDIQPRPILKNLKALLLDKMVRIYPRNPVLGELGGAVARSTLGDSILVHATCYEKSIKLSGLKAANAFWDNSYYNPDRLTFTKPIMFLSKRSLREELLTLGYISWKTGRSFIMPNVLIGMGTNINGIPNKEFCRRHRNGNMLPPFCAEMRNGFTSISSQNQSFCAFHNGEYYWPSWRTLFASEAKMPPVLEPGYYYRIQHDLNIPPPNPVLLRVELNTSYAGPMSTYSSASPSSSDKSATTNNLKDRKTSRQSKSETRGQAARRLQQSPPVRPSAAQDMAAIEAVITMLLSPQYVHIPRIVLDVKHTLMGPEFSGGPSLHNMGTKRTPSQEANDEIANRVLLSNWAQSSVSDWNSMDESNLPSILPDLGDTNAGAVINTVGTSPIAKQYYLPMPALPAGIFPAAFESNYRLCWKFLIPSLGNRSCFGLCK